MSPINNLKDRRRHAVQLRVQGASISEAQTATGLARHTVIRAFRSYQTGGWPAVEGARPGRPRGAGRALSVEQEAQLCGWICTMSPDQLGLPHLLWSNEVARELIQKRFGIALADRTMALYLKRWGFGVKHPFKRFLRTSYNGAPAIWFRDLYPSEAKGVHQAGATLLWCDWQGLAVPPASAGTEGPAAVPRTQSQRIVLYAMTTRRATRWLCYERLNTSSTIHFFDAVSRSSKGRVLLVLLGTRIPERSALRAWLRNNSQVVRVTLDHEGIALEVDKFLRSLDTPVPVPLEEADRPAPGHAVAERGPPASGGR